MSAKSCSNLSWNRALRMVGDPVDVVTGAQAFFETDFRLQGKHIPVSWTRHYDSRRSEEDRGIGRGFRLSFDVELRFDLDGMSFVNGEGETIEFPFLEEDDQRILVGAHELERLSVHDYRVYTPGDSPCWEFQFQRETTARPSAVFDENNQRRPIRLSYDNDLLAAMQIDMSHRVILEYAGGHLISALLLETNNPTNHRLVRYQYDPQGRLISAEDAYGGTLRYGYDARNRVVTATDRRGYSFLHVYDSQGRCIHTRGEDGVEEYRFDYKPLERLTVVTRGDGGITNYYYDEQNAIVQVIDACGGMTAYLKDDSGRIVAEVDPNGNKSEILYDDREQPYAKRDPLGHVRLLPADPTPHPLSHRLPESPLQWEQGDWSGPAPVVPQGVPIGRWLPPWLVETWGESPTTSLPEPILITNAQGLPVREERKDGKARRWAYDLNGYHRWFTDLDGKTRRFEYASWNHLQREIDPLGSVTEFGYTKSEQVASMVDPLGTRHDYGYDKKDRLVEVRRHGKVRERYKYDAADNLIEKADGQGKPLLTFAIGPANLLGQRRLASGDVQHFEHTKEGRLAKAKNRAGTATFAYNAFGHRIVDERDGKGVRHRFASDQLADTTVFGRFTTRYIRADATTRIILDPAGQTQRLRAVGPGLVERAGSNDVEEVTQYDLAGRCLLKVAEGGSLSKGWARRFAYSGEGDLLRRDDTIRGTVTFEQDDAHRLSKASFQGGATHEYVYDRAGNLLRAPGLAANMQGGNRLLDANDDRFTYSDRDHVASREGRAGKVTYTYDARDLLVGVEGPGLSYGAVHDGLARRVQKTVNGKTWHFYWDTDRLAAEIFPDGRLRIYVYADAFALVPLLFVDYDSVDADPAVGKRYHIYTDHLGCPELVLDDAGDTAWRARIEPYGTAEVDVGQEFHQPLRWPGHYFDEETGLQDNRFRTYSPELGRYLQSDPAGLYGGLNLYAYTDNPLRAVDLRGLEQKCPKGTKNCRFEKEGGPDAEKPPVVEGISVREARAAASDRTDRRAQRARKKLVRKFLEQHGEEWDPHKKAFVRPDDKQIRGHMRGHDYTKPIVVGPPPPLPGGLAQYQHPKGFQGSYYTDPNSAPEQVGIGPVANTKPGEATVPKIQKIYNAEGDPPYVKSTSAEIDDTWSIREGTPQHAQGGAIQYTVSDHSAMQATPSATSP